MSSDAAYAVDLAILATVLFFISLYVLHYYVKNNWRTLRKWVLAVILLSIWICISPPAILLIDIDATTKGVSLPWMSSLWMSVFWITQVLSWVVLPLIQEYVASGEFTPKRKLLHSLKLNTRLYLVLGSISGTLIAYVSFVKGLTSVSQLEALVLAAANAFGLVLIILFLAYGMATIPKRLWRRGDVGSTLEFLYWQCPSLHDDLENARVDWCEMSQAVRKMSSKVTSSHECHPFVHRLMELVEEFEVSEVGSTIPAVRTDLTTGFVDIDLENPDLFADSLVDVHAKLKKAIHDVTRLEYKWREVRQQCVDMEERKQAAGLVSNLANVRSVQGSSKLGAQASWIYWHYVRKTLFRLIAFAMFVISVLVAWSEFTLPFVASELGGFNLSVVSYMVDASGSTQITWCAIVLVFMAMASYWSAFQFKLFNIYELTPHHSDPASLCFTTTFLTRLIMPLCYNFLFVAHLVDTGSTGGPGEVTYSRVFGNMDVVDFLGEWFNRFLPIFILILYICLLTNVFGRILAMCGITTFDVRNVEDDKVTEGKDLVRRMRRDTELDVFRDEGNARARATISNTSPSSRSRDDLLRPASSAASAPSNSTSIPMPSLFSSTSSSGTGRSATASAIAEKYRSRQR
eukprot:PhM_4_TR15620/c1_g1_i3/m.66283